MLQRYSNEQHLNVGSGEDLTIGELARLIAEIVGYTGKLVFDSSKPDGAPRKLLDVSKLSTLGWRPSTSLREGLTRSYAAFLSGPQRGK
jgi:GDP-L-fucose synthase